MGLVVFVGQAASSTGRKIPEVEGSRSYLAVGQVGSRDYPVPGTKQGKRGSVNITCDFGSVGLVFVGQAASSTGRRIPEVGGSRSYLDGWIGLPDQGW